MPRIIGSISIVIGLSLAAVSPAVALTNGTATFTVLASQFAAGQHNITATYSGDNNFVPTPAGSQTAASVSIGAGLTTSAGGSPSQGWPVIAQALSRAGIRLPGRAIALLVLVGALLVASIYPLRTFLSQRSQIGSREASAKRDCTIACFNRPKIAERTSRHHWPEIRTTRSAEDIPAVDEWLAWKSDARSLNAAHLNVQSVGNLQQLWMGQS